MTQVGYAPRTFSGIDVQIQGWNSVCDAYPTLKKRWGKHSGSRVVVGMGKWDKLIDAILKGRSDANIPFDELRGLLLRLGFEERIHGSHHLFRKAGIEEKVNLQRDGKHAKPYQVKQVRQVLLRYRLTVQV